MTGDPVPGGDPIELDAAAMAAAGWQLWGTVEPGRFLGNLAPLWMRPEGGGARLRIAAARRHTNASDVVHGGIVMTLADVGLFAAAFAAGIPQVYRGGGTIDFSIQFLGKALPGEPLDSVAEVLRETARFVFLRGLIVQGERRCAAFSGTIRKRRPEAA